MTIIKLNDDLMKEKLEINGCRNCPFCSTTDIYEYGEVTMEYECWCSLIGWNDSKCLEDNTINGNPDNNPIDYKPDNCPLIGVESI